MKKKTKSFNILLLITTAFLIIASLKVEGERKSFKTVYPKEYESFVEKYAREYNVDDTLVYAIIHQESKFNPLAVSRANARGLMQITEDTFEWLKMRMGDKETIYDDLFDPETNIKYGTYFLSILRSEFSVTETQLAGYNAGINITKKWLNSNEYSKDGKKLDVIPYLETKNYVKIVMENYRIYRDLY